MKITIRLFLAVICLMAVNPLMAEWMQMNCPSGGTITDFAFSGNITFAATQQKGVYRSTDNGNSWVIAANNGFPEYDYIQSLIVKGTDLFAGIDGGVFRSSDNGDNWVRVDQNFTRDNIKSLAVCGTDLFAATWGGGIYRSGDNGNSWLAVNNGLIDFDIKVLAVKGAYIFAGTDITMYRSSDNGNTWVSLNLGSSYSTEVQALTVSGERIFAAVYGQGVYCSSNNGNSWITLNNGFTSNLSITDLTANGTHLLASIWNVNGSDVYKSIDNGNNWTKINIGSTSSYILSFAFSGTNIFAGTQGGGVFRSSDSGDNWYSSSNGLPKIRASTLMLKNNTLFAGAWGAGMYRSEDDGLTWLNISTGLTNSKIKDIVFNNDDIFVATDGSGVFHSTNNGNNWSSSNVGLPDNISTNALAFCGSTIFAGMENYDNPLYRSSTNGTNWTAIFGDIGFKVKSIATKDAQVFIGTWGQGILRSTDFGNNWSTANNGLPGSPYIYINSLVTNGTNLYVSTGGNSNGFSRSTDNANTWSSINAGLPSPYLPPSLIAIDNNVFAGIYSHDGESGFYKYCVYCSADNGASWNEFNGGLPSGIYIYKFVANSTYLYAGTNNGIWKRPLSEIVSIDEIPTQTKSSILQNYPNPFNPTTTISYDIKFTAKVKLTVYNAKGELVQTLTNSIQTAGNHKINFDASNLNSGIYFYKLEMNDQSFVNKMLLCK